MTTSPPFATVEVMRFASKTAATADGTFPLAAVLDDIRTGTWRLLVEAARGTFLHGTTAAYAAAKGKLPAVTFAGTFAPTRSNDNLVAHSGVVMGDVDHLDDPQALKTQLAHDPHVAFAFLSPSGYGLKIGVRVEPVVSAAAYRHAWTVLATHYGALTGVPWDPAASAIAGLCFASYDPDLYWNPAAVRFPVPELPAYDPEPARRDRPPHDRTSQALTASQRYAQHALHTAVRWMLRSQPGTKHHTRLRAARLVGGHIATGALAYEVAWDALHEAAQATTDNLPNALRTLRDGLTYGHQAPIAGPQVDQVEATILGVDDEGVLPPAVEAQAATAGAQQPGLAPLASSPLSHRPRRPEDNPNFVDPWLGPRAQWHGISTGVRRVGNG
jgi:hypothetical protein